MDRASVTVCRARWPTPVTAPMAMTPLYCTKTARKENQVSGCGQGFGADETDCRPEPMWPGQRLPRLRGEHAGPVDEPAQAGRGGHVRGGGDQHLAVGLLSDGDAAVSCELKFGGVGRGRAECRVGHDVLTVWPPGWPMAPMSRAVTLA